MTQQELEIEFVVAWVSAHYVHTGQGATVSEIAAGMGWPEERVRAVLTPGGYPLALQRRLGGTRRGWDYSPTRETLRREILKIHDAVKKLSEIRRETRGEEEG